MKRVLRASQAALLSMGIACPVHALLAGADPVPQRVALGSLQPAYGAGAATLRENPALLALDSGMEAGIGATRALGIEDLPVTGAWAGWGNGRQGAGLWWRQSRAGELFREDLVMAGAAVRRGDWAFGAAFEAIQVSFAQGLGSAWAGDVAIGVWGQPLSWLSMGLSGRQLLGTEVGRSGEGLERDWSGGVAVQSPEGRFVTTLGCRMPGSFEERPTWQVGQSVRLAPWLTLRGAVRLEPLELAIGAGTAWNGLALDASLSGEGRLGWQSAVALGWSY